MGQLLVDPFPEHDADGSTVTAQGTRLRDRAGDVENVNADLTTAHNTASEGVAGDLTTLLRGKDEPAKREALKLVQKLTSGGGALVVLGGQITDYEQTIEGLHRQIRQHDKRSEQQQERSRLAPQADGAEEELRRQAGQARDALEDPLAPATVQRLTRLGGMPPTVTSLYPDAGITAEQEAEGLDAKIAAGELPDFSQMSEEEVDAYLADNPGLAESVVSLFTVAAPSTALLSLIGGLARVDATRAAGALDGRGQGALDRLARAQRQLSTINQRIAEGGKLTPQDAAYIEAYTNELGAENITRISAFVDENERGADLPPHLYPSGLEAARNEYTSPLADAILNYSNPDVHRSDAGIDEAGYHGGSTFTPADGRIVLSEMPEAIQDLTEMRLGVQEDGSRLGIEPGESTTTIRGREVTSETIGQEQFSEIANYDAYAGYADLLGSASQGVEGGADFSEALGEQAIQARQDLNAISETASNTVTGYEGSETGRGRGDAIVAEVDSSFTDGPMSEMLSVTARSEDGSSQLLLDDHDRQSLMALDWSDSAGATDVITAGTDRQPDGGGDTQLQAQAAAAIIGDVGAEPDAWGDRMNEAMEDAVLDTGLRWVDSFGVGGDGENGVEADGQDVLGRDVGPVVQLTDGAKENFMLFAAGTGDEQAVRFQAGLTHYGDQLITGALGSDEPGAVQSDQLKSALAWSGLAEGRMEAANIQSVMNDMGEEHDEEVAQAIADNRETAANKTAATFVSSLAGTATGFIPTAGPFISGGIGAVSGPIIDAVFAEDPVPDYDSLEDNERASLIADAAEQARDSRDYRFAGLVAGQYAGDPQYSELFDDQGDLRPMRELDAVERDQLRNLGDNLYEDFNEAHPDVSPVNRAETYDEPFNDALEQARVNLHEDDPEESDEERAERLEQQRAEEEDHLRDLLYGDNQSAWEQWDEENPVQAHPRSRVDAERESPYDGVPGPDDEE